MIKSTIITAEKVANKDRHFGANLSYIPSIIQRDDGTEVPALFTENQIENAMERAKLNPEDCQEKKTFWKSLFGE